MIDHDLSVLVGPARPVVQRDSALVVPQKTCLFSMLITKAGTDFRAPDSATKSIMNRTVPWWFAFLLRFFIIIVLTCFQCNHDGMVRFQGSRLLNEIALKSHRTVVIRLFTKVFHYHRFNMLSVQITTAWSDFRAPDCSPKSLLNRLGLPRLPRGSPEAPPELSPSSPGAPLGLPRSS